MCKKIRLQSEKVEARRCRNLNGGFNRFLWPDWSAAGDGFESGPGVELHAPNGCCTLGPVIPGVNFEWRERLELAASRPIFVGRKSTLSMQQLSR